MADIIPVAEQTSGQQHFRHTEAIILGSTWGAVPLDARPQTHVLDEAHAQLAGRTVASAVKVVGVCCALILFWVLRRPLHGEALGAYIVSTFAVVYVLLELATAFTISYVQLHVRRSLFCEWLRTSTIPDDDVATAFAERRPPDSPAAPSTASAHFVLPTETEHVPTIKAQASEGTAVVAHTQSSSPPVASAAQLKSDASKASPIAPTNSVTSRNSYSDSYSKPPETKPQSASFKKITMVKALKNAMERSRSKKTDIPPKDNSKSAQSKQEDIPAKGKKR